MQRYEVDNPRRYIDEGKTGNYAPGRHIMVMEADAEAYAEERVKREREEIIKGLSEWRADGRERHGSYVLALSDVVSWVENRSRGAEPAPKLEKLSTGGIFGVTLEMVNKINEIIEFLGESALKGLIGE